MPMACCPECDRGYCVAWFPGRTMIPCDCGGMFPTSFWRTVRGAAGRLFRRSPRMPKSGSYRD